MPAQGHKGPCRWRPVGQARRPLRRQPTGPESMGGHAGQGAEIIGFSGEDRNGDRVKYLRPTAPFGHLRQIIRPHQPNEPGGGKLFSEPRDCIDRIERAKPSLESGDPNAGMAGDGVGRGHTLRQRRYCVGRLERISRRHQPPNGVEL